MSRRGKLPKMFYELPMTFVSYSQNFEDVLLWRAFADVGLGFYIDVGASHPDIDSVTRAFYDRGWHGINVEPTAAAFLRLTAARPRDINLQLAMSSSPGSLPFYVVEGVDAGLSTLDESAASRFGELGVKSVKTAVEVDTLAAICRKYAVSDIHFLKVDAEGAERSVLEGADFAAYRPWIVLVEATAPMSTRETHADWDGILLDAGYRYAWFDGLNRFYIALEHFERLSPKFRVPPNVFDNFLRAADVEWTRRLTQAETRSETLLSRALAAEKRVAIAQDIAEVGHLRSVQASAGTARAQSLTERLQAETERLRAALGHAGLHEQALRQRAEQAERDRALAHGWLDAMRRSTSWRLTGPMRRVLRALGRGQGAGPEPAIEPEPAPPQPRPETPPIAALPHSPAPLGLQAVHQFHSGTAIGDAITNAMLLTRGLLRDLGYDSNVFAEHRAPGYEREIYGIDALPADNCYALIVRHSMGHDALERILALPVPKILLYHNITPTELLGDTPHMQAYALKGREQLRSLRPAVVTALADSEFNAFELRQAGFTSVASCPLLFDIDRLLASAPAPNRGHVFTVLFVGRLARSKGQLELVMAYSRFRAMYQGESRLVLVGRNNEDAYATEVFALVRRLKLDTGAVEITGIVNDDELHSWYAAADLYVSLSRHEGFGVPLVEAMAHDLPILALPSGAVPSTLGGASALLQDYLPTQVATRMFELATDPAAREAIANRQRRSLDRFRLDRHIPTLAGALEMAGARGTQRPTTTRALVDSMQFTIAGHVNGSYSLAEVNRSLAVALEKSRPGAVRMLAVEGDLTMDLSGVPPGQRDAVSSLMTRPAPLTGPHVVISQHYPVWVPAQRGDLTLALFFWEESLVPAATVETLNAEFGGVLAPSRSVAKALVDSGVEVPVRVLGHTPCLDRFRPLQDERAGLRAAGPFTFLHISSGFPRKGVDVLLTAYAATFRRADPVTLVIKCFPNPHNTIAEQIERLRISDPHAPSIELIDTDLADADLLDLYRRADVMVLPSRGEGFNLPAAEALASGLKLIVTGHGGHMDFLQSAPADAVRLLDYTMESANGHLSTPFSLWAEPDPDDLTSALREAVQGRIGYVRAMSGDETPLAIRLSRIASELLQSPKPPEPTVAFMTTWDVPCGIAGYSRHLVKALPSVRTVFADRRTSMSKPAGDGPEVIPTWTVGTGEDLHSLAASIVRHNPRILVVQHQPGLLPWRDLPLLVDLPAMHGRVLCIALHNTQHMLEIDQDERQSAINALSKISRVVVHTIGDVNRLARLGLQGNVAMIPQGVPDVDDQPPPDLRHLPMDRPVLIGCYGFFLPDKGIDQLIEAIPLVQRCFPQASLRLVNAAYPIPLSAAKIATSKQLVGRLGLEKSVEFVTDFLQEHRSTELLAQCDLIVLPYQRSTEASSAALRSAMAAQVPIVVTPLSLFDEAETAVSRFSGGGAAELAEGIVALLADREVRQRLVENAAAWRRQRAWSTVAQRWNGLLRGLAGSGIVVERDRGADSIR